MKCLDFCRQPSLGLALLLTLALTVACGKDGGGSSASGGSSSPSAPSPSAPQPAECKSVNCVFSGTVAAYGVSDPYLLLPAAAGQLTLTLTWADSSINLDLSFCRVYAGTCYPIIIEPPTTGSRESYSLSMAEYEFKTSDSFILKVLNNSRFSSAYTLAITIGASGTTPPPSSSQFTVNNQLVIELFNADDNLRAKVNGVTVAEVGYGGSTSRDVTSSLRNGANTVDIELENTMSAWTYGYRMRPDGALVVNETCGQAGTTPCSSDRTLGIVYRRTYSVWKN